MRSYLFDPNKQFQDRNGVNNVNGFLRVFLNGTDDRATTYRNFNGTINPSDIPIDNNGRAVVIVDADKVYRIEVYSNNGNLLWSQYPLSPYYSGGVVYSDDIKPLVLKQFGKTLGNYNPLQGNTIAIGNSAVQIDVSTSRIYSVIQSILADERTPVLVKTVHRDYGTEELLYYPTARTGASSDYSFMGYNGGVIEFAKVKDDDSVSYETYEGGEGRIVYIGYEDADIYTKVSDAFAAGLVPVVKDDINADSTIWKNYYWPLNLSAYEAPVPGEEDGRNGYYFVGKAEIRDSEGNPLAALEMIQVKPDSSVSTSYIPERQTPQEEYSDFYGIGLKTNSFGQVTEVTSGTQQGFMVRTGSNYTKHVLTAEEIAQGYYDIYIGLPYIYFRGKRILLDSIEVTECEILASINRARYDGNMEYSVSRLEVLLDFIDSSEHYFNRYICRIDDFTKDEFGRLIPNDFIGDSQNDYRYNFLRVPSTGYSVQIIKGFVVRNYINTNYEIGIPIAPGITWPGPRVDITLSAKGNAMSDIVANLKFVSKSNTLRFRFSDPSYSPVEAGVGSSGTWTKREEFTDNVWDWTNNSSSWIRAFKNAWTSEEMDVELVAAGDTSAVTDVLEMFRGCSALISAIAFDTSNVTSFVNMFKQCTNLKGVPYFETGSATHVTSMFEGCTSVKSGAIALYTRMSGQATPPIGHINAFKDCGKDTTEGLAELQQIPESWGGLAP